MNTNILLGTNIYTGLYLSTLDQARNVWKEYESRISARFPEFKSISKEYFENRSKSSLPYPPLNAYVPLLIAEPFGLDNSEIPYKVALANLYLDHFTQVLDDATDNKIKPSSLQLHFSHHLLMEGTKCYLKQALDSDNFIKKIDYYFEEAMQAERFLWRHHMNILPYENIDFTMIGQRCALVKISTALFADITSKYSLQNILEIGIDSLSTGIQIVDDLIDWKEDWKAGIYTYPIVLAMNNLDRSDVSSCDELEIEHAIFSNELSDKILFKVQDYFEVALQQFKLAEATSMVLLTNDLITSVKHIITTLTQIRRTYPDFKKLDQSIIDVLLKTLDVRLMH